jgi:hypothetical protein
MKIARNMEIIFIVAVLLAAATAFTAAWAPSTMTEPTAGSGAKMGRIMIIGEHLNAIQKATLAS